MSEKISVYMPEPHHEEGVPAVYLVHGIDAVQLSDLIGQFIGAVEEHDEDAEWCTDDVVGHLREQGYTVTKPGVVCADYEDGSWIEQDSE
ncbi:hypothetical protein JL_17 [Bacillus phage JL]|nr:hypothetical protein AVV47_gp018 [Bacillus phage JL]AGR46924.1 hypothetical protein JL_17 [Bacillus phage JL]